MVNNTYENIVKYYDNITEDNPKKFDTESFMSKVYMFLGDRLKSQNETLRIMYPTINNIDDFRSAVDGDRRFVILTDKMRGDRDEKFYQEYLLDYKYLSSPSLLLSHRSHINVYCFVNENEKNTVIIAHVNMNNDLFVGAHWQVLTACLPAIMPWVFAGEHKLSDGEQSLIAECIVGKINAKIIQARTNFYRQARFNTINYEALLKGFGGSLYNAKLFVVKNSIKLLNERIEEYRSIISNCIDQLENEYAKEMFYQEKILKNDDDEELIQFFKANPSVIITDVNKATNSISYVVDTYLNNVNEQSYEDVIVKDKVASLLIHDFGSLTHPRNKIDSVTLMKNFWKAVWEEQRFKIRVRAGFCVDSNAYVTFKDIQDQLDSEGFVKNPHSKYHCFGGFGELLTEAETKKDIIGAIHTTIQYTKNLNLCDTVVVNAFCIMLMEKYKTDHFIEDENGNLLTMEEAINILKEEYDYE